MTATSSLALSFAFGTLATTAALASDDPWALLSGVAIDEKIDGDSYTVTKVFPAEIENGIKDFFITGYAVPLTPGERVSELMLVSDMGNCPFCGSGDHGVSLQVELDEPIIGLEEGTRISLRGALEPVHDTETWQSTILRAARVVDS